MTLQEIYGHRLHENYFSTVVLMELAFCLSQKGSTVEAERYLNLSMEALKKVYAGLDSTRSHAFAHIVLGDIKAKNKEYKAAQNAYRKADSIYQKKLESSRLKNLKADDISHLYKQLAINSAKLGDSYATSFYLNKHIEIFGEDHKRSLEITKYLQDNNIDI